MRKFSFLASILFISLFINNVSFAAAIDVESEVKEINEVLEDVRQEANDKIKNNEESFTVEGILSSTGEKIFLEIDNIAEIDSDIGLMSSTRSARYQGTLRNAMGAANTFRHQLIIDWTYNSSNSKCCTKGSTFW